MRHQFEIVAGSSVDRLGCSLQDLVAFLDELHGAGVDLYLDRQGVDTSTPAGKASFQMQGVSAEFELSIIQERIAAGIARARAIGTRSVGGRSAAEELSAEQEAAIRASLAAGTASENGAARGDRQRDRRADRGRDASRLRCG